MPDSPRVAVLVVQGASPPDEALLQALCAAGVSVEVMTAQQAARRLAQGPTPRRPVLVLPDAWRELPPLVRGSEDLERALDALGRSVARFSPLGALEWASSGYQALPEAVRRKTVQAVEETIRQAAWGEAGTVQPVRRVVADEQGRRRFELALAPIVDAAGLSGVIAMLRDMTSELESQRRIEAIDRAGRELLRLDPEEIRQLNAADRLNILQQRIARAAHDLLRFDHFTIRLIEPGSGRLEPVIAVGVPREAVDVELYAQREGSGLSGYVAATGRSVLCRDVTRDERYIRGIDSPGSSLTVPLLINDRVIGVLNVESEEKDAFTDDDLRFAEIFARYVALSLHILDLLVAERSTTNEQLSGRMVGEIREPLEDLERHAAWLRDHPRDNDESPEHVQRMLEDIEAIRARVKQVAMGPRSLLGAEVGLQEAQRLPELQGKRILVVDDEATIRSQIADVLQRRGALVRTCETGSEAIDLLRKAAPPFDLVLSDIRLPDRNGYEVFRAAKEVCDRTPVVLMTGFGYDPHHSVMRASQEGLHAVLFKPFHVSKLLEVTVGALQARSGAPNGRKKKQGGERKRPSPKRSAGEGA